MTASVVLLLAKLSPVLAVALVFTSVIASRRYRRIKTLLVETRHDPLTGLPNRRGLQAHWDGLPGEKALILIDLEGFKAVNDSYGHIVGDALLRQVALRLASAITPPGILARWGGDEFVAVIPAKRAEAQQALLRNAKIIAYDLSASGGPSDVRVGARIGVSVGAADLESALQSADRGLLASRPERNAA